MELKQIKELMTAMGRSGVQKLRIKRQDFELELDRGETAPMRFTESEENATLEDNPLKHDFEKHKASFSKKEAPKAEAQEDVSASFVVSPMVGTFYTSPAPTDPAFVKVGDQVDKNTVICIVEAMKVMNEIKAGVTGTVAEVLVQSGHPVEFGTKLFRIV